LLQSFFPFGVELWGRVGHTYTNNRKGLQMKEATCSKCNEIYNPEEFGDLHFVDNCNGTPKNEIEFQISQPTKETI
jgi:hypothetical protein